MADSTGNGSDSSGIVSILAILLLVIIAGFIAYRVFAKPATSGTDTVSNTNTSYGTQPSGSTTTTVTDINTASGTINATTTTTN